MLVLMEEQVLAKLRELVGWSSGDGIFAPGIPDRSWGLSLCPFSPWQPVHGGPGVTWRSLSPGLGRGLYVQHVGHERGAIPAFPREPEQRELGPASPGLVCIPGGGRGGSGSPQNLILRVIPVGIHEVTPDLVPSIIPNLILRVIPIVILGVIPYLIAGVTPNLILTSP